VMTTAQGVSTNVSAGETIFTTLGFMGIYALLGLVFLSIVVKIVGAGPGADTQPVPIKELLEKIEIVERDETDPKKEVLL